MANQEITLKIPIDELFSKFEEHLDIENNRRILFSGKFGIGKTYFLREFFKNKKDKYESYHLFPVNYQISQNEDIIEFLKYDILIEIMKKDENIFKEEDYANFLDLQRLLYIWAGDNLEKIIVAVLSFIPKLGRPLQEIIGLIKNLLEFKKQMEKGEKGVVEGFLKRIEEKRITETDYISEIIKEKIIEQKGEKKSVLILDDLDRVDPEHIFRILNVFFAHFDSENNELPNKFGFDKVIIVADYLNLKSIFHHRYGQNTDSSGYFSKFYSVEVFTFKNEEIIERMIGKIISNFNVKDQSVRELIHNSWFKLILRDIINGSLKLTGEGKLNMWQLLKGVKFQLPSFNVGRYTKDPRYKFMEVELMMKVIVHTLISIFGSENDFISALEKIKSNSLSVHEAYKSLSFFLLSKIINLSGKHELEEFTWKQYKIKVNTLDKVVVEFLYQNKIVPSSILFYDLLIEYINQGLHNKPISPL
jgi:hypothetical protein